MAQQIIGLGTVANDGTGDTARVAGQKINDNFTEVYADTVAALTGDVTKPSSSKATTIASNVVTNSKLAKMAAATIKGNSTGGLSDPLDLTATQVTSILNLATTVLKGLMPPLSNVSTEFLNGQGNFAVPAGGGGGGGSGATDLGVYNTSGGTIVKGAPVYLSGFNGGTNEATIVTADADGAGTMPVLGLVVADIVNNTSGTVRLVGKVATLNTISFTLNDPVYVSTTGALTATPPIVGLVQEIGRVSRVSSTLGEIIVGVRSAGLPISDGAAQLDVNGNKVLQYGVAPSAVNVLEARNAATAGKPKLMAKGTDANIGLHLQGKGTGQVTGALQAIPIAVGDETTALTVGTAKVTFRMPFAFTLTAVKASVTTAPTGGTLLTVDINEAGTTVISTKLTFTAASKTTVGAAAPAVISDANLAADAEITIDIDAIGSTIAGAGLKVYLIGFIPE